MCTKVTRPVLQAGRATRHTCVVLRRLLSFLCRVLLQRVLALAALQICCSPAKPSACSTESPGRVLLLCLWPRHVLVPDVVCIAAGFCLSRTNFPSFSPACCFSCWVSAPCTSFSVGPPGMAGLSRKARQLNLFFRAPGKDSVARSRSRRCCACEARHFRRVRERNKYRQRELLLAVLYGKVFSRFRCGENSQGYWIRARRTHRARRKFDDLKIWFPGIPSNSLPSETVVPTSEF